jgi:hypothetical protein
VCRMRFMDTKKIGKPKTIEDAKRVNIYISKKAHEKAKKIGGGNFSAGVTKLINEYANKANT